jgi:septal ring factor EnvC (AmiA/AmiB activator)
MSLSSRSRSELIDQALEGQPAEVKARVLAIIVRYNIDVRNEFFLIFVAIGHLLAIVESAPENWRALFDEFERKLDLWSEQNLRTLAAVQQQGKETERMSLSFLKLTDSLKLSSTKTSELQATLKELSRTLNKLTNSLAEIKEESRSSRRLLDSLSSRFNKTERELSSLADQMSWIWAINLALFLSVLGFAAMFGWSALRQRAIINQQNERLGWLLDKANRQECVTGVKPAADPQCLQYQQ